MLKLLDFIKEHDDWRVLLKEKPYALDWKENETYILFKYNMIESDPRNEIVKEARGIIFRKDNWKPVCVSFFRFYNEAETYADKLDWSTVRVQEKMDGSKISLWYDDGKWHISTSGTIDAYECDLFSPCDAFKTYGEMFIYAAYEQKLNMDWLNKNYTYTFEIVSPFNRIVVPYKETRIVHIGTRCLIDMIEMDEDIGIDKPKAYSFNSLEKCLEAAKNLPFSEEGYVAVDADWKRNKIKSWEYIKIHSMRQNGAITEKNALGLILSGDDNEYLSYFPEYIPFFEKVMFSYNTFLSSNRTMGTVMFSIKFETRKDLAMWVMAVCKNSIYYSPFLFQLADKKVNSIEEFVKQMAVDKLEKVIFGE